MKRFLFAIVIAGALMASSMPPTAPAAASGPDVILLHGYNRTAADWNTAKAAYQQAGFTVHALSLPRSGIRANDTLKNADFVQAYMTTNGLTAVVVDGHSLGGTLVYELIRVRRDSRIVAAITRDSSIQSPTGGTGLICWFVPDQCQTSPVRKAILAAPLAIVPILNVSAATPGQADVDCNKIHKLGHMAFLTDSAVNAQAVNWAATDHVSQFCR